MDLPEPEAVRCIRALFIITGLGQATSELILNSLDAGATFIDANIDTATMACQVRDNGVGFLREVCAVHLAALPYF